MPAMRKPTHKRNNPQIGEATIWSVLILLPALILCPQIASSSSVVSYNLTDYSSSLLSRISVPPTWLPSIGGNPYQGSLDVMWYVGLTSDEDTAWVSAGNAKRDGAASDFTLMTGPDNCWGMMMNFGLVTLGKTSDLVVTIKADPTQSSYLAPAFALYQGWDTSATASRHQTITFGNNNPLGTAGLTFVADIYANNASNTVSKTFHNLSAGNYEIFVTNRSNASNSGTYAVTLQTYPKGTAPDQPPAPQSELCGLASTQTSQTTPTNDLCLYGYALLAPKPLPDGRYVWSCGNGAAKTPEEMCYSLSNKNKRQNQAPLRLQPGTTTVNLNGSVTEEASGGSGAGTLSFRLMAATKGISCKILKKGTTLTVKTGKDQAGVCTIRASKAASGKFNSAQSVDYVITFTQ